MYHNGIQVINGKCFNYKVEHILVNSIVCILGMRNRLSKDYATTKDKLFALEVEQ